MSANADWAPTNPWRPGTSVIYYCTKCREYWTYTLPKVSCTVLHSDGHCHFGEQRAVGVD